MVKNNIFKRFISIIFIIGIVFTSIFSVIAVGIPDNYTITDNLKIVSTNTINLKDGAKPYKKYIVPSTNVKEALKFLKISLGAEDTLNLPPSAAIVKNLQIKINRITYKKISKIHKIRYKAKRKYTSKLYKGQKKIKTKGKNGRKKITYTKKYINGKLKKVIISKVKILRKTTRKVILIGTKRKNYYMIAQNLTKLKTKSRGGIGTIYDFNGKKIAYKKKYSGSATAYSANSNAITSIGDTVHIGGIAVNPNVISYGSKLYIESPDKHFVYGYAVANDTGGFVYNGSGIIADLFYPTFNNCVQFGYRTINIYVLV